MTFIKRKSKCIGYYLYMYLFTSAHHETNPDVRVFVEESFHTVSVGTLI